jgi:membrane-associated phospholipid phosphatase
VAVGVASARVLTFLFPAQATRFADALRAERTAATRAGLGAAAVEAAESVGRAAAERVIARARADGSDVEWRGTVPAGRGTWTSAANAAPVGAAWAGIRPWVLSAPDQLRPGAPPAVGTPAFEADLAEVRRATRSRTPAQLASARKWAEMPLPGYWNGVAAELIARGRVAAPKATEVLTALNVALMDANIACFDAKYAHWSIRPSQADPSIDVPVMLPNFPAYPSGHACLSAAAAEVLAHHFPAQRQTLDSRAQEVADSRVWAGVHYRVDNDVGMDVGRRVARLVLPAVAAGLDVTAPATREAAR